MTGESSVSSETRENEAPMTEAGRRLRRRYQLNVERGTRQSMTIDEYDVTAIETEAWNAALTAVEEAVGGLKTSHFAIGISDGHGGYDDDDRQCAECSEDWPCPTTTALSGVAALRKGA